MYGGVETIAMSRCWDGNPGRPDPVAVRAAAPQMAPLPRTPHEKIRARGSVDDGLERESRGARRKGGGQEECKKMRRELEVRKTTQRLGSEMPQGQGQLGAALSPLTFLALMPTAAGGSHLPSPISGSLNAQQEPGTVRHPKLSSPCPE